MKPISTSFPISSPANRGVATDDIALRPNTTQWAKAPSSDQPTKKAWNTFEPLDSKINEKIQKMSPAVHEKVSEQLQNAHAKIAELELKLKLATSDTNPPNVNNAAPAAHGKLKKMAGAIKDAFANAPWKAIGKGALYATAAVAGFALLSNPIGVLSIVGMIAGSSLLPTAIGLAGAGAAVYQVHKWLGQKSDQASHTGHASTNNSSSQPLSQSLGNPA